MGGLNASLSIATSALNAQELALQTTNNNIANANTPGYSREIVDLSSAGAMTEDGVQVGDGVDATGVTSVRDQLLNMQIQSQTSSQSAADASSTILGLVQTYVSGTTGTVGSAMSSFFSSLSALSSAPTNAADRQTVISNAEDLVTAFHQTSQGMTSTQAGLDSQVSGDVGEINSIASQIATLNGQIGAQSGSSSGGSGTLEDQRSALEQNLSQLTGFSVSTGSDGDTITLGNGSVLVAGSKSYALSTTMNGSGLTQVADSTGSIITDQISGGDLGGTLQTRDVTIPGLQSQLDTMANEFATAFNAAQSTGFDLNGNAGGNLFTIPTTVAGSAADISMNTTDGSDLAVSSDTSQAGTGNLSNLTGVQSETLPSGANTTSAYASFVDAVGSAVSNANGTSTALGASLTQLSNLQSSVSGVSIDEESSNLIRYQQGYQAAAEVISTINTLFTTTLDMMSGSGA